MKKKYKPDSKFQAKDGSENKISFKQLYLYAKSLRTNEPLNVRRK